MAGRLLPCRSTTRIIRTKRGARLSASRRESRLSVGHREIFDQCRRRAVRENRTAQHAIPITLPGVIHSDQWPIRRALYHARPDYPKRAAAPERHYQIHQQAGRGGRKNQAAQSRPIHLRFPDGWSGSFEIERDSDALDRHFARAEDDYYLGVNESPCTITETIIEPNDAISQYRYEGVLLKLEDAGEWEDTKSVKQKLSFVASRRKKVS